ncbi:hypothetical protein D1007_03924 [Hordeum vulgare]|nr:hypothetical protein D1007_03924 [Hordeum vulgare]
MEADEEQPDWLNLPLDLLETIGNRSRDAVTGVTVFRSVCRTWRSALGHAPRLLLPASPNSPVLRAGSEDALIFPLSRGWSIIVDARDASCRLSRPATGATVALPKINAIRDRSAASSDIMHVKYVHHTDEESACWFRRDKIMIQCRAYGVFFRNYLDFSDSFRFAFHAPTAAGAPAASAADGMTIMMCHMWLLGRKTIVLCRPGDAAWRKLGHCPSFSFDFVNVAHFQGRIYGLECDGSTAVFDGATLEFLHSVDAPPCATFKFKALIKEEYPREFDRINLVALPGKLLLVSTRVKSLEAEGFSVFELLASRPEDGSRSCWRKVVRGGIGGNYDIFMDSHHTAFTDNGAEGGIQRIYHVLSRKGNPKTSTYSYNISAKKKKPYSYNMQNDELECVHRSPPDDSCEYSTRPSWFVP